MFIILFHANTIFCVSESFDDTRCGTLKSKHENSFQSLSNTEDRTHPNMASRLCCSSPSPLSHQHRCSQTYSRISPSPTTKPKTSLPLIHVSLQQHQHPEQEAPSSSSKPRIWVNPNNPLAKRLRRKSNSSRYVSLVKFAQSLDSCDPTSEQVSTILASFGDTVLERDAVFVLNKMENSNTAPLVMRHFRDKIKPSKDTELILYNVTLKVCRKSMDFQAAEKLFDEMLQRGMQPNNITFSTLINCARMCALPDKAVEWFEKMPGFGCEPDGITSSAMVYAYARTGNADMALKLYDRAKEEKWRLDAVAFSALIKMIGVSGNYDGCLSVYQEMKELGVRPNMALYNTLLEAMRKARRPRQAKAIYSEMISNGFSPDLVTYASLIRVYVRAQFSDDALSVYKEMKEKEIEMSSILYNVLLAMCADVHRVDEGVRIFKDMKSSGTCQPDSWTYSSMITLYSCHGKVSEAEAMLNEMIESGIEPTIRVLTSMVQCYGKAKRTDDVVKICNQLLDLGMVPDDRFCCCLLNVMAQTPNKEMGMLTDSVEKGNAKLGSVVRYLVEEQEDDGDSFIKEVSELLSSVDAEAKMPLCNSLIDLCVKLNANGRAHDLLDLGLKLEIYVDVQVRSQIQWSLHLKRLSVGAALTALRAWMNDLSKAFECGEDLPPLLGINTGQRKYKPSDKGLFSVLESRLNELNAPFHEHPNKAGWLLTTTTEAKSWLESKGSTESISTSNSLTQTNEQWPVTVNNV
ncbi:pentatricopeptide repeat-containing protein At4g16390, chloroplastic [Arachis duranensis]|uniref:Pentatricopeptide repeat-containing protein At4g16390, chloroplastic n=1 Tax=Arachis duranensis TaxID=130453 RepID=A0A6P4CZH0_ARADU|nr:pentatricopeptide repeat-containing protein At4g16390, chloroplastic [Arachis duranensis]